MRYLDRETRFAPNVAFLTPAMCDILLARRRSPARTAFRRDRGRSGPARDRGGIRVALPGRCSIFMAAPRWARCPPRRPRIRPTRVLGRQDIRSPGSNCARTTPARRTGPPAAEGAGRLRCRQRNADRWLSDPGGRLAVRAASRRRVVRDGRPGEDPRGRLSRDPRTRHAQRQAGWSAGRVRRHRGRAGEGGRRAACRRRRVRRERPRQLGRLACCLRSRGGSGPRRTRCAGPASTCCPAMPCPTKWSSSRPCRSSRVAKSIVTRCAPGSRRPPTTPRCELAARLFDAYERFDTPVDVVTMSEVSVAVTVDDTRHLDAIVAPLGRFAEVSMERGRRPRANRGECVVR